MPKLINCETCGTEFLTSKGRFCSKECRPKITKICEECGIEFSCLKKSDRFCKIECRTKFYETQDLEKNKKKFKEVDLPECRICGFKGRSLNQHLINKHNISLGEYCNQYDIKSEETYSEDTRKKLSDSISGEKNVWFNHNGKMSPFSKDYVKYEDLSEEEKELKIRELNERANKDKLNNTTIEYYINQGLSEEEAKQALTNRQTTFSLEKCIEKYGEEIGLQRWQERQKKWQNTLLSKSFEEQERLNQSKIWKSGSMSKISQELFNNLKLPGSRFGNRTEINDGELMEEIEINGTKKKIMIDYSYGNKIIDFNGDYWHANPIKYKDETVIFKRRNGYLTAKEIREIDELKIIQLRRKGYKVKIVWESEYKQNKEKVINECLKFLQS